VEERPPIWRVAAIVLHRQSRTGDKELSFSFGVGRGANNSSPNNLQSLGNISQGLGIRTIVWHGADVTQVSNRWQALVNAVMNLRAPYNVETFLKLATC